MTDSDLRVMTNERLEKMVQETQETLDELKLEVERRHQEEQNREIDNLDIYMEDAELSLKKIRHFVSMLLRQRGD